MKIILVAHGQLASGFLQALELITGDSTGVQAIDFCEGTTVKQLEEALEQEVLGQESVLFLSDLMVGIPFKSIGVVQEKFPNVESRLVTGLNLSMLLEANFLKLNSDLDELVSKLVNNGKNAIQSL
ncbi:TPA: PTS sugar transporter subunit IIA [Streptococcus suis]